MTTENSTEIKDSHARARALDISSSFIVQAPAGSGKTELLTQRILALLATVERPEEILAITFTKKAAAEMRHRVLAKLSWAQTCDPTQLDSDLNKQAFMLASQVIARNQKLNWNLLDSPHRLRIQTIDSFCASIVDQMPMSVNFVGQANIAEDASKLYEKAAQATLKHINEDDPFAQSLIHLLQHVEYDYYKLEGAIQQMLAKRDQWAHLFSQFNEVDQFRAELENNLALIIEHTLQETLALFPADAMEALRGILPTAGSLLVGAEKNSELSILREWLEPLRGTLNELPIWRAMCAILLTKDGWRKRFDKGIGFTEKALKQKIEPVMLALSANDELKDLLEQIQQLPPANYSEEDWQIVASLLFALKLALANLSLTFREENQVDFTEIALQALNALGDETAPTDLMLAFDYRIRHILIDEFQDTSKTQTELLRKLTGGWENGDGRTLFVVGDPMQSIYRFRKAEVGLFMSAQHFGVGNIKLEPLHLVSNFRSHYAIVNWNNFVFSSVFPKHEDSALGAIPYSASVSINQDLTTIKPVIHLLERDPKDKDTDFSKQEAEIIVKFLRENSVFPQKSIAILVRSRSQLLHITHLLRQHKLSFQATEIESLSDQQHIQDLISLTRCILHPADKIHALNVLRSPWCGINLSDLHIIASDPADLTLFELLERHTALSPLTQESLNRSMRVLEILRGAYAQLGRAAIRGVIESAWQQLGGPVTLKEARHFDDAEMYFQLLENSENAPNPIQHLMQSLEKLYAAAGTEKNAIQIMTMHKSKGLEFDIVILPGLNRKSANDEKALLSTDEVVAGQSTHLLLAPIEGKNADKQDTLLQRFLKTREKRRAEFETQRLFYVACTRAKQQLHLFATVKLTDKTDQPYQFEAGALIKPLLINIAASIETKLYNVAASSVQPLSEFTSKLTQVAYKYLPQINTLTSLQSVRSGFSLISGKNYDSTVGEVVHRLLEHMATTHQLMEKLQIVKVAPKMLAAFFYDDELIKRASELIVQHIENTLNHEFARNAILQAEFAELSVADENQLSRIDLVYKDESNCYWVIDYKTTAAETTPNEYWFTEKAKSFSSQLKRYQDAVKALSSQEVKAAIFFTAYGELIEVALDNN